jgi:hypothetical protein
MLVCMLIVFSLHRESPNLILEDEKLISEVVLSQKETARVASRVQEREVPESLLRAKRLEGTSCMVLAGVAK